MLVSVHLPKTAGASFATILRAAYGERLRLDYADFPINTDPVERQTAALAAGLSVAADPDDGFACVHGHFLPIKYLLLASSRPPVSFVTWLRHPVDRVVSHYHFWRRYQPQEAARLHRRVQDEAWSLERFCLCPELRNLYSQFFWAFPVTNFSFVGVTEYFDEDLLYFCRHFLAQQGAVAAPRCNARGVHTHLDPGLRTAVEQYHAEDMNLYRWACELRARRPEEETDRDRAANL